MKKILLLTSLLSLSSLSLFSNNAKPLEASYVRNNPTYTFVGMSVANGFENTNGFEKAYDKDATSWAWIDRTSVIDGSYILLDLGDVYKISSVNILQGKGEDYSEDRFSAVVGVSSDNEDYYKIGSFDTSVSSFNQKASCGAYFARYIKLYDLGFPSWGALREFSVDLISKYEETTKISTYGMDLYGDTLGEYALSFNDCIIDDSVSTYAWFKHVSTEGAYLQLDFNEPIDLTSFELCQTKAGSTEDYNAAGYTFSYSLDGENYTDIASLDGRHIYKELDSIVKARYLKATLNEVTSSGNDLVISSFRPNPNYRLTYSSDLKLYSGIRSGYGLTHVDYVDDNNEDTFVDFDGDSRKENSSFQYDLGLDTTFYSLSLITGLKTNDKLTSFTLTTLDSNKNETNIGTYSSTDGLFNIDFETPLNARYLKFSSLSSGWLTINEISVNKCLDEFLSKLDETTCLKVNSLSSTEAEALKEELIEKYEKLSTEEKNNLNQEDLNKYNYMVSYLSYLESNNSSFLSTLNSSSSSNICLILTLIGLSLLISTLFITRRKRSH